MVEMIRYIVARPFKGVARGENSGGVDGESLPRFC